eukprot:5586922-Amphidinium_carterae.1
MGTKQNKNHDVNLVALGACTVQSFVCQCAWEVECDGWPYVFAVAQQDIHAGEELTVDHGDVYWAAKRAGFSTFVTKGLNVHSHFGSRAWSCGVW